MSAETLRRALAERAGKEVGHQRAASNVLYGGGGDPSRDWNAEVDEIAPLTDWDAVLPARANGIGWKAGQFVKRVADVVLASVGLVVALPLFLLVGVAIRLDSRGPVFYPWHVVGYRGRRFTGYKLRTMVADADRLKSQLLHLNDMTGPVFKMRDDPRVTRVGRILRKASIDELPQLLSVLKGDMSLVGPRPMFAHEFVQSTPIQRQKLAVRPGITCTWQVTGRSKIVSFEDWNRLDHEYIREWSLGLDLRILGRTLLVVMRGIGAH